MTIERITTQTTPSMSATARSVNGTSQPPNPKRKSILRSVSKKEITIMLIGETGAGKTAFMSLLINLFTGNGPYELEERDNPESESGADKSQSQTNDATMYSVRGVDGTVIRILDTPGLADTREIDQDKKHKEKINKAIQDHIKTLDAVVIMANGTIQRLGAATEYTLHVIASLFPYKIIDNIGFIFTHTDPVTFNFQKDSLRPELKDAQHWLIQNPLAYYQSYKKLKASGADERVIARGRRDLEQFYDDTGEELNKWLEWLDARRVQPSKEINDLYQMSTSIDTKILGALTAVERMHEERISWTGIQADLLNTGKGKDALKKLKEQETAPCWKTQKTAKHNTVCYEQNCNSNCHIECGVNYSLSKEVIGGQCSAFCDGRNASDPKKSICDQCGHIAELHFHDHFIRERKPTELTKETREALEAAEGKEGSLKKAEELARKRLDEIEKGMNKTQSEIRDLVDQYNSLSLSRNFAGHIQSTIKILEHRKEELQSRPDTKNEVDILDGAIKKLREKLRILSEESTGSRRGLWDSIRGVWRSS